MFQQLVGKLPVGICIVDENYNIVFLNDFFIDRMESDHRSDYTDKPISELFPEQAKFLRRRIKSVFVLQHPSFSYWEQRPHIFPFKSSRPITGEETQMYQNMEIVPITSPEHGKLACIFLQDVTAQASYFIAQQELSLALKREHEEQLKLIKKLDSAQSQLIQAEKMASTGQLAAGIAHEINNPIGFVTANLNTLKDYAESLISICESVADKAAQTDEKCQIFINDLLESNHFELLKEDMTPLLDESREGLERVRDIVENLKRFAIEESSGWQLMDLSETMSQMIELVSVQYKIPTYKLSCQPECVKIFCEPGGLKQALMNMLINAAQSIDKKGIVKVNVIANEQSVQIKIIDSGSGIEEHIIKKVFDPFFTTKPEGLGQGLGLSVAYTAIEKHQGTISVSSKPGVGSVFEVNLPVIDPEEE